MVFVFHFTCLKNISMRVSMHRISKEGMLLSTDYNAVSSQEGINSTPKIGKTFAKGGTFRGHDSEDLDDSRLKN
jgi:hypothetical protein